MLQLHYLRPELNLITLCIILEIILQMFLIPTELQCQAQKDMCTYQFNSYILVCVQVFT